MKLIEGRYYQTVDGVTVGPMVEREDGSKSKYYQSNGNELTQLSTAGLALHEFQKWNQDGSVYGGVMTELKHVIVKQVPAPGFTVEVGGIYETVDGETVGPLVDNSDFNMFWPFYVGEGVGKRMYYKENGYSCPGMSYLHKKEQDLVHKVGHAPAPIKLEDGKRYVLVNGDVITVLAQDNYFYSQYGYHYREDGKCCYEGKSNHFAGHLNDRPERDVVSEYVEPSTEGLELKIVLDAKEAQKLIDDAAKVFDEAAGNLLKQVADKDEELRAAKEAFNILYRDNEVLKDSHGRVVGYEKDLRNEVEQLRAEIEKSSSMNKSLFNDVVLLRSGADRRKKEIAKLKEELNDAYDSIEVKRDRIRRYHDLMEKANIRNASLRKRAEGDAHQNVSLWTYTDTLTKALEASESRKMRGDNRLRETRHRLRLANERVADAEDQLKAFSSGKVMARNALILLGVVFSAFASGGFFF